MSSLARRFSQNLCLSARAITALSALAVSAALLSGCAPWARADSRRPQPSAAASAAAPSGPDEVNAMRFVLAMLRLNGLTLDGLPAANANNALDARALYRWAADRGQVFHHSLPAAGDLVFFHNTYDRDRDQTWDDLWTWVAVVESVRPDGTVTALGYLDRRVVRLYLNPARPQDAVDAHGTTLNSLLRSDPGPEGLTGSAGALFAGFADPFTPLHPSTIKVIDRWQPEILAWQDPPSSTPSSTTARPPSRGVTSATP
jgi:hypothetical protein